MICTRTLPYEDYNAAIAELTYASYRYNRDRSPEVRPEQWAAIFPGVTDLEARYRAERGETP